MNPDPYSTMNIPTLRKEVSDRGILFGNARTADELAQLLRDDDITKTGLFIAQPLSPKLTLRSPSPVLSPRLTLRPPSPPRKERTRPINTGVIRRLDLGTERSPAIPVMTGVIFQEPPSPPRIQRTGIAKYLAPATTIPTTPIVTTPETRIPTVPIAGTRTPVPVAGTRTPVPVAGPRIPTVPVDGTPVAGTRIPTVPITGTRIPIMPVAGTPVAGTPVAGTPVAGTRIPTVPGTGTRIPTVPIAGTRTPVPVAGPRIPTVPIAGTTVAGPRIPTVPIAGTGTPIAGPRTPITPIVERTEVRRVPIKPTPEQIEDSIRRKTASSYFNIYDIKWTADVFSPDTITLRNPALFANNFIRYKNITVNKVSYFMMEYLMTQVAFSFIIDLVSALGFKSLNSTPDTYYNLLWYLNWCDNRFELGLSALEIEYISPLDETKLLDLLGVQYRGPRDKASLLFALVSGKSASRPDLNDLARYETVRTYAPDKTWAIANDLHHIITDISEFTNGKEYIINPLPPYVYIASLDESPIENIIAVVNEENVDQLTEQYGIALPPINRPISNQDKINYFIKEIVSYDPIFKRPVDQLPPPILTGRTNQEIEKDLEAYTSIEIVNIYEPIGNWTNRKTLIAVIALESRGGAMWAWRHQYCNNDDTLNNIELTLHGEINKDDPQNLTLSYGIPGNYRCYQIDELLAAFANEDGFFVVPDYNPLSPQIDPTTGRNLTQMFPPQSIQQLRKLLESNLHRYKVADLIRQIDINLKKLQLSEQIVRQLKSHYDIFGVDEKYLVDTYLCWMFLYSMWLRFWKGRGYEWPIAWYEGGGVNNLCTEPQREWRVQFQATVRDLLLNSMTPYPGLNEWIDTWPLFQYDFNTENALVAISKDKLGRTLNTKLVIDLTIEGNFCLADASDKISQTAYYLIIKLLGLPNATAFNEFLNKMAPVVFKLELDTINWLLSDPTLQESIRPDLVELLAFKAELEKEGKNLPSFNPKLLKRAEHTDPDIGKVQYE